MSKVIKCCIDRPVRADLPSYAALVTALKWPNGQVLRVRFLDGDPDVQDRVAGYARKWSDYASIGFEFGDDPGAEIRISFRYPGSWSYIGTDALDVPAGQ